MLVKSEMPVACGSLNWLNPVPPSAVFVLPTWRGNDCPAPSEHAQPRAQPAQCVSAVATAGRFCSGRRGAQQPGKGPGCQRAITSIAEYLNLQVRRSVEGQSVARRERATAPPVGEVDQLDTPSPVPSSTCAQVLREQRDILRPPHSAAPLSLRGGIRRQRIQRAHRRPSDWPFPPRCNTRCPQHVTSGGRSGKRTLAYPRLPFLAAASVRAQVHRLFAFSAVWTVRTPPILRNGAHDLPENRHEGYP